MSISKSSIAYLTILIFIGITSFGIVSKWRGDLAEMDQLRNQIDSLKVLTISDVSLQGVDSLLLLGQYGKALQQLRILNDSEDGWDEEAELRLSLSQQLFSLRSERDSAIIRAASQIKVPVSTIDPSANAAIIQEIPLEKSRPDQYDSLNFALKKSRLEAEQLQQKLTKEEDDDYLSFVTNKGSTVYYVGDVDGDKADGRGVGLYSTGSRYEGEWQQNLKHGQGKFYWQDGAYYEGSYRNDLRNGHGAYYWPNGDKYVGQWQDDLRHGKGIFYNNKGIIVAEGLWKEDEFVGN